MITKQKISLFIGLFLTLAIFVSSTFSGTSLQPYSWKNVEIVGGGFVPGIIFNTKQKNLIYARTDIGGAYRWNPSANRWIPLTDSIGHDDWSYLGIDSLATDPVEPNRVYLAAGMYTNSWTSINAAILRSSDQGNTWQRTVLPFKLGGNMPGRSMGERLAIDPNKNSILYLGTRLGQGLWKSTDFGVTWNKVTSFTAVGTYIMDPANDYTKDIIGVVWVTFDPSTGTTGNATQTIYVGVADKANSIYRSTDAGNTWQAVPGQPNGYLPHHGILGSNGILYISYSDTCGPYDGEKGDVWKFNTKTGVWTNISPVPSSSSDDYFGYGGLAVDAQKPNTLMVATLNSWWPDATIFRSTDAGATWTRIWDWDGYPDRKFRYIQDITAAPWLDWGTTKVPPEVSPKLGWMIGDLEIDPFNSDRMMYGTGATIYGSDNLTAWDSGGTIKITVKAMGLEETAVLDLISPPSGPNLFSALGDIGGFRHDDLTKVPAKMYTQPTFSSTTSMDYAELSPSFMVRVGNGDDIMNSGFTYDGGKNWFQGNADIPNLTGGGMVAAASDASLVVWSPAGSSAPVSYSKDNGNTWITCTGIPSESSIISDRVNPKKFYGFSNGKFYISTNGGSSFSQTSAAGLPVKAKIKAVPGIEGDIWLAGEIDGLWHSTNSGTSFTKLTTVQTAYTIGFGKAAAGQAYMALYSYAKINDVYGIFRSDDKGATWVRINDDQHQYGITNQCLTGDPRIYGRIYLATNGRGIIYGDPTGTIAPTPTAVVTPTPTPTPTTIVIALGDVNADGAIDIIDALLTAQYTVGIINPSFHGEYADVNKDGMIDIIDALKIAQFSVGIITKF